jgi:hypothetical protein
VIPQACFPLQKGKWDKNCSNNIQGFLKSSVGRKNIYNISLPLSTAVVAAYGLWFS